MLKNKKAIYLLLPLNLLIWGFFVYRIYSAFNEDEMPVLNSVKQDLKLDAAKDSVTYKLSLNYKDPFLKDVVKSVNYNSDGRPAEPKKAVVVKTPTVVPKQLPDVKYLGLIKNNESGLSAALVSVNGQSRLVKQNENIEGVVFKSFNKDSLVAKWGRERMVVRK